MVVGVDRFRAHFAGHEHQYVLIGGAALELIMGEVGLDFRATKDLDIVLIVEALDPDFAESFWSFIEEGGYEIRERSDGEQILYRFQKPTTPDFPAMLELFSRTPPGITIADESHLTPIPISEGAASLSAILLDEDYYEFLTSTVRTVDGLPVLSEAAIIPFKAKAWLELRQRRAAGEDVDARNITKHRNDVARLLQLLPAGAVYALTEKIRTDMASFVGELDGEENFDPRQFGVEMTQEVVIQRLKEAYGL